MKPLSRKEMVLVINNQFSKVGKCFDGWITGDGLFKYFDKAIWNSFITPLELDIAYFGSRSGQKLANYLPEHFMDSVDQSIADTDRQKIADAIWTLYGPKWERLWSTNMAEYNPDIVYNITEVREGEVQSSEEGTTGNTRTNDLTHTLQHGKTITESDIVERESGTQSSETTTYNTDVSETETVTHGEVIDKTGSQQHGQTVNTTDNLTHGETVTDSGSTTYGKKTEKTGEVNYGKESDQVVTTVFGKITDTSTTVAHGKIITTGQTEENDDTNSRWGFNTPVTGDPAPVETNAGTVKRDTTETTGGIDKTDAKETNSGIDSVTTKLKLDGSDTTGDTEALSGTDNTTNTRNFTGTDARTISESHGGTDSSTGKETHSGNDKTLADTKKTGTDGVSGSVDQTSKDERSATTTTGGTDTGKDTGTVKDAGTSTKSTEGSNRLEITRSGNPGILPIDIIRKEISVWQWVFFNIVFADIDKELTTPLY